MFQHRFHARRVVRRLEGLDGEQRKGGVKPDPLALRNRIVSFILQCTKPPHFDHPMFVIPPSFRAVSVAGDVGRVNGVVYRDRNLNFRSFPSIN